MKKLLVFLLLGMFLISFTSAFQILGVPLENFNVNNTTGLIGYRPLNMTWINLDGTGYLDSDCYGYDNKNQTASIWFKTNQTNISKMGLFNHISFNIIISDKTHLFVGIGNTTGIINSMNLTLGSDINDSNWHNAILDYKGAGINNLSFYLDGTLLGSNTTTTCVQCGITSGTCNAGYGIAGLYGWTGLGTNNFKGSIDEWRVYQNSILSNGDINSIYSSGRYSNKSITTSGLFRYYPLNENGGTLIDNDTSHASTLIGDATWQSDNINVSTLGYNVNISIVNVTNALTFWDNGTLINQSLNNTQATPTNFTFLTNQTIYVLENYKANESNLVTYSPIWFSVSNSTTRHIASNLTSTVNIPVIVNNTNCNSSLYRLIYTTHSGITTTWTGATAQAKCILLSTTGDNLDIEPATGSNILDYEYLYPQVTISNGTYSINQTSGNTSFWEENANLTFTSNSEITNFFNWLVNGISYLSGVGETVFNYVFNLPSTAPNATVNLQTNEAGTSYCFQESADVSNQTGQDGNCGLKYNGIHQVQPGLLINYTKPTGINATTMIWSSKLDNLTTGSTSIVNISILDSCLNFNTTSVELRVTVGAFNPYNMIYSCKNETDWQNLLILPGYNNPCTAGAAGYTNDGNYNTMAGTQGGAMNWMCTYAIGARGIYEESVYWGNEVAGSLLTNETFNIATNSVNPIITANLSNSTIYVLGGNQTLGYNITEINPSVCWYNYAGVNTTLNCSQSFKNITTVTGYTNITVYANDTVGNNATPVTVSFVYDSLTPSIFINSGNGTESLLNLSANHTVNYTITDSNLDSVWLISGFNLSEGYIRTKNQRGSGGLILSNNTTVSLGHPSDLYWNLNSGNGKTAFTYESGSSANWSDWQTTSNCNWSNITEHDNTGYLEDNSGKYLCVKTTNDYYIINTLSTATNYTQCPKGQNCTIVTLAIPFINWQNFSRYNLPATSGMENTTSFPMTLNSFSGNIFTNDTIGNTISQYFEWDYQFIINSQSYSEDAFETDNETFILNFSSEFADLFSAANLEYNGTNYTTSIVCTGQICIGTNVIDIPLINASAFQENSFKWYLTVFNGTNSISTQIGPFTQNVSKIFLVTCNASFPTQALNFTLYDEQNRTKINNMSFAMSSNIWLGAGTVKRINNLSSQGQGNVSLCLSPNQTIYMDATVNYNEFNSTTYSERNWFSQSYRISNVSQDIFLYLLPTAQITSFILKVQDANLVPVPEALIYTQRYYPATDEYQTEAVSKTDSNGLTVGFFQQSIPEYRFIISLDGEVLLVTDRAKVVCQSSPCTLTFTIGTNTSAPWSQLEGLTGLDANLTYNETTMIARFTYIDTSGNFTSARLYVTNQFSDNSTLTTICNTTSTFSSAVIACDLSAQADGTFIISGFVIHGSSESLIDRILISIDSFATQSGMLGLFLGALIILVCAFAFTFNEIAGIVLINVAVIFVNFMGLIKFGNVFVTAMVGVSILIIAVMER